MKMVVGAAVIAILIVCGAYFGSHLYYGDDPVPFTVDSQPHRVSVGTSTVDSSEVDELTTSDTFADESDSYVAESPDAMGHSDEGAAYSPDTQVIDEPSTEAWDWAEELREARHEESVTDLSDQELRERFLADVESGKFARKMREYFEREHGKGPEVDVLVHYYDKLFKGQATLSDHIEFKIARQALGVAGSQEAASIDSSIEHLQEHGDGSVGGKLTVTSLNRLRYR